jgi:hypothetical protein
VQGHLRAQPVGAIAYLLDSRLRYAHFVWHLFVLGGSACHFSPRCGMRTGARENPGR